LQREIDLAFNNMGLDDFDPNFVTAVVIVGAAQEVYYVNANVTVAATNLTTQDFGAGVLLSWPPGQTNYLIQQNSDLTTTNWVDVTNPTNFDKEMTGKADPAIPMGTNWAYFGYTNSQMFYRLWPAN
jgi:hypothetical protein